MALRCSGRSAHCPVNNVTGRAIPQSYHNRHPSVRWTLPTGEAPGDDTRIVEPGRGGRLLRPVAGQRGVGRAPGPANSNGLLSGRPTRRVIAIRASLFASNIGSEHVVGLHRTRPESTMGLVHFAVVVLLAMLCLGCLGAPAAFEDLLRRRTSMPHMHTHIV